MGMLADFYAGDMDAVMKLLGAIAQGQPGPQGDALVHADFSLNLQRADLDNLSMLLHRRVGRDEVGLFDSIGEDLDAGPEQSHGVHEMRSQWTQMVAAF